jgi:hypothetical protein
MSTIAQLFINALLADASYVDNLAPGNTAETLTPKLSTRMTPDLAKFIGDNFTVVSAIYQPDDIGAGSGFDAVVWRGNANTPYAGQLFVSTRGTEGTEDFLTDVDLSINRIALNQLVDMVNWWLQISTPVGHFAKQLEMSWAPTGATDPNGAPIYEFDLRQATQVAGSGLVTAADLSGSVFANGHSLGGYLASAFTRLLGTQAGVDHTTTFNSAGFAPGSQAAFNEFQAVLGASLGRAAFPGPGAASQTNAFATHGINVATNTFWFEQQGVRVELFNEEGTGFSNHYMYKLTDALALANALSRLDSNLTISRANALFEAGSNNAAGSIEGVLDGLRRLVLDPRLGNLPTADADGSAGERVTFHQALLQLQEDPAYQSLAGRVNVLAAADIELSTLAHTEFGAIASGGSCRAHLRLKPNMKAPRTRGVPHEPQAHDQTFRTCSRSRRSPTSRFSSNRRQPCRRGALTTRY